MSPKTIDYRTGSASIKPENKSAAKPTDSGVDETETKKVKSSQL